MRLSTHLSEVVLVIVITLAVLAAYVFSSNQIIFIAVAISGPLALSVFRLFSMKSEKKLDNNIRYQIRYRTFVGFGLLACFLIWLFLAPHLLDFQRKSSMSVFLVVSIALSIGVAISFYGALARSSKGSSLQRRKR